MGTASLRAYMLADRIGALLASDTFHQKTMAMVPAEFRDFLASEMEAVLHGRLIAAKSSPDAPPLPQDDPFPPPSAITDQAARQLIENAPLEAQRAYGKCRRNGGRPAEALGVAMRVMAKERERVEVAQVDS